MWLIMTQIMKVLKVLLVGLNTRMKVLKILQTMSPCHQQVDIHKQGKISLNFRGKRLKVS